MKKSDLIKFIGKKVLVVFTDGSFIIGTLKYADEFSSKHEYRKPKYFYIEDTLFKPTHVKKIVT